MTRPRFRFSSIFLVFVLASFANTHAEQSEAETPSVTDGNLEMDIQQIHGKLAELKTDNSLEKSTRTSMTELYESALRQLRAAEGFEKNTRFYRESALNAAGKIENLRKKLKQTIEKSKKNAHSNDWNIPSDRLRKKIFKTRTRLESLKNNLERLDRDYKRQQSRPEQIRIDQRVIQDKLHDLKDQQHNLPSSGIESYKAQLAALHASEKALHAEMDALEMELSSHPPRLQLLRARYDLAISEVASESAEAEILEKFAVTNRQSEAARFSKTLTDALLAASNKAPLIRQVIRKNFGLGNEFRNISERIGSATTRRDEINREAKRLATESENSEKKIDLAGLSPTLAALMREQRRLLPSDAEIDQLADTVGARSDKVTLRQFEIEEDLKPFLDIDRKIEEKLVLDTTTKLSKHQRMRVRVELELLFSEQKALLLKLNDTYSNYLHILGEIDYSKQQLSKISRRYSAFLDENLLWVRSSPPINLKFFWNLVTAARWIVSPQEWWETGTALLTAVQTHKLLVILFSVVFLGTLGARRTITTRLNDLSKLVHVVRNDRFRYTLDAIGYTVLRVTPLVITPYFVGWLLDSDISGPEFSKAVGSGLCAASIPLFLLQTFSHIFSQGGIAELHLKWTRQSVSVLGTQLNWLKFVVVPCIFVIIMTGRQSQTDYSDSLGRLALVILMVAISTALGKALQPTRGALSRFLASHSTSLFSRTRYLWYSVIVIIPLVIAGFAAAGFLVSAVELQQKMVATIRIVFIAVFVHALSIRGLRLFNRKLALKKYREKRQAEMAEKPTGEAGESLPIVDPDEIDISTINIQSRRLLLIVVLITAFVGLWLLWENILPALAILNEWVLWHKSVIVDGVTLTKPVALSNLLTAILYIMVAVAAIRNLPGVMEILIMNRLSLETGSRYAMNQLISYCLIAATLVLVATELGGQWSQVQWLIAALGVGLGFGLQEIFANFVSGIILLFERPIRIGDTVTVGDITGTVTRIQIRATTITDWDRKDLVVPNKSFITDQVVNWTRTDNITRILIPIGIAYGSDTKLAHRVISETVRSHSLVLSDPEATVFFVGFGDSSLDFEIRLFVKDIANRLPLTHDLHMQLNQALNEVGIEIPFPQRDIHMKSTGPDE